MLGVGRGLPSLGVFHGVSLVGFQLLHCLGRALAPAASRAVQSMAASYARPVLARVRLSGTVLTSWVGYYCSTTVLPTCYLSCSPWHGTTR